MKTFSITVVLSFLGSCGLLAQTAANISSEGDVPAPSKWQVMARGANHRVWQWETYDKAPDGRIVPRVHQVTELAAGMHYQDANGQWQESQELIESYPGGAIARQGQHQVIFANNINSFGAIDMQTPDGKRLKSNLLGLMYYDNSTGDAVMIAELQDSTGEMISDNRVLYPNAFNGVQADVQYTYTRGGFEQDVILREQPPAPELFGMNPDTTELEVFTEFINPPKANVESDSRLDEDQTVSWGAVSLGRGKAFNVGGQDQVGVSKRYVTIQGRHFLLEKVSMKRIKKDLSKLPEQAGIQRKLPYLASKTPYLPPQRQIVMAQSKMKLAKANRSAELGYVLDYVTLNASYTNYTFQGDSTYYISGAINLCGTNIFEGGAVIKYATNAAITLVSTPLTPGLVFKTGAYRPVLFTAKDDNTAGDSISGSTGNPSGYYANPALNLQSMGDQTLHDFRISYAAKGLSVSGASPFIYDAQFVKCAVGVSDINGDVALGNVLFTGTKTNFVAAGTVNTIEAQQVTFNNSFDFIGGSYANTTITLTNCLLANVTNVAGTINAGYNGFFQAVPVGDAAVTNTCNPFQVVGAGSCYLTNGCVFVDAGTTNLDAAVWDLIRTRTTCPPLVYSNTTLTGITNFSPLAPRDVDVPDLGYHYDPLDYAFGGAKAATNLVATAGTAFGWFELTGANNYALSLPNYCSLTYNGTVVSPCVLARYSAVQEGGNGLWTAKGTLGGVVSKGTVSANTNYASQVIATFTHFAGVAGGPSHVRDSTSDFILRASHCEFTSSQMGGYNIQIFLTNCLLDATYVGAQSASSWQSGIYMVNCTMREFLMVASHWSGSVWPVRIVNTIFEKTALNQVDVSSPGDTNITYCDFNAFMTNANRLPVLGAHDVTNIVGYNWQTSWLGDYYLPTNSPLINAGSATADQLALYHFTTQTDQTKETNSTVDIGYHYVATDVYGNPYDTDGDDVADYIEDANGNGVIDSGESSWDLAILIQPADYHANAGDDAMFSIMAVGASPLTYQWRFNGTNITGATNSELILPDVMADNVGNYSVIVSNIFGNNLTSSNAFLSVNETGRLGYWSFDNTNSWVGSTGQLPIQATNIVGVPSGNTNAMMIDSTNAALLTYPDKETNGHANIALANGSMRFLFKPNWGSLYANPDGSGTGPGHLSRLIEVGKYDPAYTNGWWGLNISSDGYFINFGSSTNGGGAINLSAYIFWNSNDWHWVVLTYSQTNSVLYLDGVLAASGAGVAYLPNATERASGFRAGSDPDGGNQAGGAFDELETFNYSFSESEALDSNQDGIPDSWALSHGLNPVAEVADLPSSSGSGLSNLQEYLNSAQPFTIFVATPKNAVLQQ